jgi:hypothetical protein
MTIFKHYIQFAWKRVFTKWIIFFLIAYAFVSWYFIQMGISNFKHVLKSNLETAKYEQKKASQYLGYKIYGAFGVNLRLSPPPLSIFFNDAGLFEELSARINGVEMLDIFVHRKGSRAFKERPFFFAGFAGWLVFTGSFGMLIFGFNSLRHIGLYKIAAGMISHRKIFLYTVISGFLITLAISVFLFVSAVVQVLLNGISLAAGDFIQLGTFFIVWLAAAGVFFFIGALFGSMHSKITGIALASIVWLFFIYLGPLLIRTIVNNWAMKIPSNISLELKKWNTLVSMEKRFADKFGKIKKSKRSEEVVKSFVKNYFDREFKTMWDIEDGLRVQFEKRRDLHQVLSIMMPSTFLISTAEEMSGKGFNSMAEFHEFVQKFKIAYFKFLFEKFYISKDKTVASFVKSTENIFLSRSSTPGYFAEGVVWNVFVLVVLIVFTYRRFLSLLYKVAASGDGTIRDTELDLDKGISSAYSTNDDRMADILYSIFSGQSGKVEPTAFNIQFSRDSQVLDACKIDYSGRFFFLCSPGELPGDIKARDLITFVSGLMGVTGASLEAVRKRPEVYPYLDKSFGQLKTPEKNRLLLALPLLKRFDLYLFDDNASGMPPYISVRLLEIMETISGAGGTALYINCEYSPMPQGEVQGRYIREDVYWAQSVRVLQSSRPDPVHGA